MPVTELCTLLRERKQVSKGSMWYWVDSLENGGSVYSCNFEGNKRSLLYNMLGSVLKQAQSCVLLGSQSTSRYL